MAKKGEFEKVFGTTKASKKNWDLDVSPTKNKKKKKKTKKDLFGRKLTEEKSNKEKKRSLDKTIKKAIPKKKEETDAWLPIDINEIGNLQELKNSKLAGMFRIVLQLPDTKPFMIPVVCDGDGGVFLNGSGIDFCRAVAEALEGGPITVTDYDVMNDKLSNGKPFISIDYLNTSLVIQI